MRMTTRTTDIWIIVKCLKGISKRTTTTSDTQMTAYCSNGFFRLAMAAISPHPPLFLQPAALQIVGRETIPPLQRHQSDPSMTCQLAGLVCFISRPRQSAKQNANLQTRGGFHLTFFFSCSKISFPELKTNTNIFFFRFEIAALKDLKSGLAVIAVKANCWKSRRNHKPFADETAPFFR